MNWEIPIIDDLRNFLIATLRKIIAEWRVKRNEANKQAVADRTDIDTEKWFKALPDHIRSDVQAIVESVVAETETPTENQANVVKMVHNLVPEYPYYHWRHLHTHVQDASKTDYERQDYYRAFLEAVKRYINTVRTESQSHNSSETSMMGEVFGQGKLLSVTKKYKKPDGTQFNTDTVNTIEDGQKFLSMGILSGARNPMSHAEIVDLRDSNLFGEKDCLDALSLLSHLFRRLDDAIAASDSNQLENQVKLPAS